MGRLAEMLKKFEQEILGEDASISESSCEADEVKVKMDVKQNYLMDPCAVMPLEVELEFLFCCFAALGAQNVDFWAPKVNCSGLSFVWPLGPPMSCFALVPKS